MACESCPIHRSLVVDSRPSSGRELDGNGQSRMGVETIRRRRECCVCGRRFTTYELKHDELEIAAPAVSLTRLVDALRSAGVKLKEVRR